jgi:membrane-associated phospholipid phosphatase
MSKKPDYKMLLWGIYYIFYLIGFFYIESIPVGNNFHLLSSKVDDFFPFCEYFVIPYFMWFLYFPGVWIYLALFEKKTFIPFTVMLFTGMTLFIFVSLIYPNYIDLRVEFDKGKNLFTKLCALLQNVDTPTNVFPSIHVFNSMVAHIGIRRSELGKNIFIRIGSFVIMSLICIATLFMKQHSFVDFLGGAGLTLILYIPIYIIYPYIKKKQA